MNNKNIETNYREYTLGINATAIHTGISEIELVVKFNYPSPYLFSEKYFNSLDFYITCFFYRILIQRIKIIEPISVQLNPYHKLKNSNSILLLKPNSEHKLSINKDLRKVTN